MKHVLIIPMLFLSACVGTVGTTAPNVPSSIETPCPTEGLGAKTIMDEKARYAANLLYVLPAQAYTTANKNGLVTAENKAVLKPLLQKMYKTLLLVRSAYDLGNAGEFSCQLSALQNMSTVANQLLPKGAN